MIDISKDLITFELNDYTMNWFEKQLDRLGYSKKNPIVETPVKEIIETRTEELTISTENLPLPVSGGRSSVEDDDSSGGIMPGLQDDVKPEFSLEWIGALETLAAWNGDVGYAVDNIINLGATKHTIYFKDGISDALRKEMLDHLADVEKTWYDYSSGMHSLKSDLFAQMVTTGAISWEAVPNKRLDGIESLVKVSPKVVRFKYDDKKNKYSPFQKVKGLFAGGNINNLIPLNTTTYKYTALRKYGTSPYAVPPLLSAIEPLITQRDQIDNFKFIMKKMGIMGFLQVLMTAPTKRQNDTDETYMARCETYLRRQIPELEKSMAKGIAMGFKGSHEFTVTQPTNAAGAEVLYNLNEQNVMTGLKQDPGMLGRQFNTSETFGRVILAKLTMQVGNYQIAAAAFLEWLYGLELLLAGYQPGSVTVEFEKPAINDTLKEEQARQLKITNGNLLVQGGIIDRLQLANELGYDKPALDDDEQKAAAKERADEIAKSAAAGQKPNTKSNAPDNTSPDATATNSRKLIRELEYNLNYGGRPFDYHSLEACQCGVDHRPGSWGFSLQPGSTLSLADDSKDSKLEKYLKGYAGATGAVYNKAVAKAATGVSDVLLTMGANSTLNEVNDAVVAELYKSWPVNFSGPQRAVINKWVTEIYTKYRMDKSILVGLKTGVPEASFNLLDIRAIEYYKNSDNIYLGKFITDPDTRNKISGFIKQRYIDNNLPIGNNPAAIADFKKQFKDVLDGEDWKIRRVIDTTVNKMRNTAAVNYMQQADVQEFEIVGVKDRLQCDYCKSLQGYRFSVKLELDKVERLTNLSPEEVSDESPFITSLMKPEDVSKYTAVQLQKLGIGSPPYHPHCRDVVAAVLD